MGQQRSAALHAELAATAVLDLRRRTARPRIASVATSTPPHSYTQDELLDELCITDPKVVSVFRGSAIERRHLVLPPQAPDGTRDSEGQAQLLAKQREVGLEIGAEAIVGALKQAGLEPRDVDYLCCVTSTGLMTPGFSARLLKQLRMRTDTSRLDVVGMGCNAGLNALSPVASWAETHPGHIAVMVCIEVCSAAYAFDATMRTSVVNSLFGDGAAAVVVSTDPSGGLDGSGPQILHIRSHIIPEAVEAMRFDWDEQHDRYSFYLDPDVPYIVGANIEQALGQLLDGSGLRRSDIAHWLIHSGGKKVIDSLRVNVNLSRHDVRHTLGVLRDYGNVSSGSFLFSYERLTDEGCAQPGDYGVMVTMGPGSTIETALLRW